MRPLRLGLVGDHIAASRAPDLHRAAGRLAGVALSYERIVPAARGLPFDALLDACARTLDGVNVTHPYKEAAAARCTIPDPATARMGAVNTVLFRDGGMEGHNTDRSGLVRALAGLPPGPAAILGCGGMGRAAAFALADRPLRLHDADPARAAALAALTGGTAHATAEAAAAGAAGLLNCTPVGMEGAGRPGATPLDPAAMAGAAWAFDAVYTPPGTRFLRDAAAAGLATVAGTRLFFWQGVDAFALFTGRAVEPAALARALGLPLPPSGPDAGG